MARPLGFNGAPARRSGNCEEASARIETHGARYSEAHDGSPDTETERGCGSFSWIVRCQPRVA